jgi:SET domain-containing protein
MLKVQTYIDKSTIKGVGVFAAEKIPKGTLIWEFTDFVDIYYSKHVVENMKEGDVKTFLKKYCYLDEDSWQHYVLCVDNARFMNHSDDSNTENFERSTVAKRDIAIGEEITCNYYESDDAANEKLNND